MGEEEIRPCVLARRSRRGATYATTKSLAEWIATLDVSPWVLLLSVNVFLIVAGLFLPPVAVILMTAPTLVPMVEANWF